jgi:hypothetical protein
VIASEDRCSPHRVLPTEDLYWALLDASALPVRRQSDAQALGFLFENALPAPIDTFHAVYHRAGAGGGQILACAMPREDLRALMDTNGETLSLCPEKLPAFISERVECEPSLLNLLTREFEPRSVKRGKRRWLMTWSGIIATLLVLVIFGLERRTAAVRGQIAQTRGARAQLIAQSTGIAVSGNQPAELRFLAELRSLRQTRQRSGGNAEDATSEIQEVTPVLADLLGRWPKELHVLVESLSITPTTMTLRGQTPSSGDVQSLANAFDAIAGWRLQQPQISSAGAQAGVNATLQWKRETSVEARRGIRTPEASP